LRTAYSGVLSALERLDADAAGELPAVRPLIIAADMSDRVRVQAHQRTAYIDTGMLKSGKSTPPLTHVSGLDT
jgi:hypothetical protein